MELSPRRLKASGSQTDSRSGVRAKPLRQLFVRNDDGVRRSGAVQSLVQQMGVGQGAESERLLPAPGEFAISRNSQSTISKYAADHARSKR
jgi:hypothetical protein